jgi:RimJ/RimL family protein N-acetyltransferase
LIIAETDRLRIRWLIPGDEAFMFKLLNEPSWIRFIGDKGVRTPEDARRYIETGPMAMYERVGFGLYLVELKETRQPIGICGPIRREALDDPDLGFAFLPPFWRHGYAFEAATAVMSYARSVLALSRIVAILTHDNRRSRSLLERLGFRREGTVRLSPNGEGLELHAA